MTLRLTLLGWLLLSVAVVALAPGTGAVGGRDADRLVMLDLGRDGRAVARVHPDRAVRLVLHLEVPEESAVDPKARWTYGVALTVVPPEGPPTSWTHHVQSRVSFDPALVPLLKSTRPGRRVTDGRVVDLDPGFAPEGGWLEVSPVRLPEGARLLLRLYEQVGGTGPGGDLARTWSRPFPPLTGPEWAWYAGRVRRTLAPEVLEGETVAVQRRPGDVGGATPDVARILRPGEATAVNVWGPARLSVGAVRVGGRAFSGGLAVDVVGTSFVGPIEEGVVTVPPGALWSVRVRNVAEEDLIPVVRSPEPPARWGDPPVGEDDRVRPEERRLRLVRVDDTLAPVRVPVDSGAPVGVLRVDARASRPSDRPVVSWRALSETGEVLASGAFDVPWTDAPFERYADPTRGRPGEVVTRFILHPKETRTIAWTARGEADLRFLVPAGLEPRHPPGYRTPASLSPRYAPWDVAPWLVVDPLDRPGLVADDRFVTLVATVRLEGSGREAEEASRPIRTHALRPRGAPPRHPAMEPVGASGGFEPWHRTRLGRFTRLQVPEDGVVRVDHRVPRAGVGETATLTCGDVARSVRVPSSRGRLRFSGLPVGWGACTLAAPSGLWLAAAPGSGERWAHRTLYRVDHRALVFDLPEPTEPGVVFVRPYTPAGRGAPTVVAEIDGGIRRSPGAVRRPSDVARLYVPDTPKGRALLDNGGALDRWPAMRIALGEDLAGTGHTLVVQATSPDDGPVYVRLDASWDAGRGARPVHHWPEAAP